MRVIGRRGILQATLLGLFLLYGAGCAVDPVTGGRELMLMSEADEINLGRQTDRDVVREYGIYEDERLTRYAGEVCQRIGKLSHRPQLEYQFKILDSPVVNAFAVPGGWVYFTRGILASLNSEAELAGVMGHEIGHVTARHSAEQYSRAQLAQVGLGVAMMVSATARAFGDLAQFGVGMLFLKFSRNNETESDSLGVEYASRAGYDAGQMAHFFGTLEQMSPKSDRAGLPEWFSTHPNPANRQAVVLAQSREWQQRLALTNPNVHRERYLRQLEGLTYGEDPRQGYVEDGMFYHPELRFQFPVPRDWIIQNTPSLVAMGSPRKDATITFTLAGEGTPDQAAQAFLQKSRARVLDSYRGQINGLPAVTLVTQIQTQQGTVGGMSYFVQLDRRVFVFHGFTPANAFSGYRPVFERTMGQFDRLRDAAKAKVRSERIRIRQARRSGTVRQALQGLGVAADRQAEVALLNGMQLDERVAAGTLLKTVKRDP